MINQYKPLLSFINHYSIINYYQPLLSLIIISLWSTIIIIYQTSFSPFSGAQVDVDRAEEATQMLTSEEGASKARLVGGIMEPRAPVMAIGGQPWLQ